MRNLRAPINSGSTRAKPRWTRLAPGLPSRSGHEIRAEGALDEIAVGVGALAADQVTDRIPYIKKED